MRVGTYGTVGTAQELAAPTVTEGNTAGRASAWSASDQCSLHSRQSLSANSLEEGEAPRSMCSQGTGEHMTRAVIAAKGGLSTGTSWCSIGEVLPRAKQNSELWQPGLKDEVVPATTLRKVCKGAAVTVFLTVPCLTVVCLSTCAVIDLTHIEGRLFALESSLRWEVNRYLMVFNVLDIDCDRNSGNSMTEIIIETPFGGGHALPIQIIASCASSTLASPDSFGAVITAPHRKISNALTPTMAGHPLSQNIWRNCETAANASLDRQDRWVQVRPKDIKHRYDGT